MKSIITKYESKLYEYLNLADSDPVVCEEINNKFIDIVFHTDAKNILSSLVAMAVIYFTLLCFEVDWYLHAWLICSYAYYFVRFGALQFSKKGEFLGIKRETKRFSNVQVIAHGSILGGLASGLYLIVSYPPYPAISELITVIGVLVFLTAALSLNSNLPLWCFSYMIFTILPVATIMVLKGGFYIMCGIIVAYYGFFIFHINLRYYKLYYDSYLFQHQNKIYLDQLHDSKKKLEEFVNTLQTKNKELTYENRLRKAAERKIQRIASVDTLTGVTNRVSLEEKMNMAIRQAKRSQTHLGIFFIDLDRFKFINDTFGHGAGDELLRSVAQRLQSCLRSSDLIFRIGGDEFILVLTNVTRLEVILTISQNLLTILSKPHMFLGKTIISTVSMGISIYPQNGTTPENLLQDADIAMYQAKQSGGNAFFFYTEEMNKIMSRRLQIEKLLLDALDVDGFKFLYQPVVCLKTGKTVAAEALIRFSEHDVQDHNIGPGEFIPIAEETGLIGKVGHWGIQEVCRTLKDWEKLPYSFLKIALNISVKHLVDTNFLSHLGLIIETYKIDPTQLEIEITESQAVENMEFVNSVLGKIVSMGISLSIDDFGTGHSNFSYLKDIPISKIKIDRSFLKDFDTSKKSRSIVQAIISVAKALDLKVVAEGIETLEQFKFLRDNGCDYGQGYLYSAPVSEEAFIALVEKGGFDLEKIGEYLDSGKADIDDLSLTKNSQS